MGGREGGKKWGRGITEGGVGREKQRKMERLGEKTQRKTERERGKGTNGREREKGKVRGKKAVMCLVEELFVSGGSFSMYCIMPYVGSGQAWNSA